MDEQGRRRAGLLAGGERQLSAAAGGADARARPPRVGLLSGGLTAEAQASRSSAADVRAALDDAGFEVVWLDLSDSQRWTVRAPRPVAAVAGDDWREPLAELLRASGVELVFPAIHGPVGEDGELQALCESLSLPYAGCGPRASLACFDKARCKRLLRAAGLPVAPGIEVARAEHAERPDALAAAVERELGYPCIVKPSRSGSSIGLARADAPAALGAAVAAALDVDDVVLVERLFRGADVEIGVVDDERLVVGAPVELDFDGDLYDFETKYAGDRDRRHLPARLPAAVRDELARVAGAAFRATGCDGFARVDVLVDRGSGDFVVNEINTIPYMPATSTFTTSVCHVTGQSYRDLLAGIVRRAAGLRRAEPAR